MDRNELDRRLEFAVGMAESAIDLATSSSPFGLDDQLTVHRILMDRSSTPELGGVVRTEQVVGSNVFQVERDHADRIPLFNVCILTSSKEHKSKDANDDECNEWSSIHNPHPQIP